MRFYNEHDIYDLRARTARHHADLTLYNYANYLNAWVDIINRYSDGWAYWKAGSSPGCKLADLIERALRRETITRAQFTRAVAGIKSIATRKGLPLPNVQP